MAIFVAADLLEESYLSVASVAMIYPPFASVTDGFGGDMTSCHMAVTRVSAWATCC